MGLGTVVDCVQISKLLADGGVRRVSHQSLPTKTTLMLLLLLLLLLLLRPCAMMPYAYDTVLLTGTLDIR